MHEGVSRELIEACMRNEPLAQQRMFQELYVKMMRVCMRYSNDEEEARSHFVNGLLRIFTKLDKYDFQGSFEGWASRVMINNTLNTLRNQHKYLQETELAEDRLPIRDVACNDFELRADAEEVLTLVRRLPTVTRKVFLLFAVDGYSHNEIAELLKITAVTSRWHLSDARKRLVKMIQENYKRNISR